MSDGAEFFAKAKQKTVETCPEGMSVTDWKRAQEAAETQRFLDRGNSDIVRDPIEDHSELADLFRRGNLVKASELEAKRKAQEEAHRQFEQSVEDRQRDNRYEAPRATTKDTTPIWKRERIEE